MHAFVILSIIAVVSAGQLGYDYQLGVSGVPDIGSGQGLISRLGSIASPSFVGLEGLMSVGGIPNLDYGAARGATLGLGSPDSVGSQHAPIISAGLNKEFYSYSAPEEEFNDNEAAQRAAASLKKNLRVVFIKAPENNGLTNAALQLAKQATEDKTAIYVLSKQTDLSELANQVQGLRDSVKQKPEVRFIKYRTPEDAINAQRTIQQQYDSLGGSSKILNEGIAPVLNFASHNSGRAIGNLGENTLASNISPSRLIGTGAMREYLPPIVY